MSTYAMPKCEMWQMGIKSNKKYTSFNSLSELLSGYLTFGSKSLASSYSLLSHLLLMHKYSYIITNISK